jgi:hypothetical protein
VQAPSFTIENVVGRLVECRIRSPIDIPQVAAFAERLREVLPAAAQGGKVVICVDLRAANVFPPEVADGFTAVMRSDNPMVERSGFVAGESALFGLQIERLIRDAQNPARRAFRDLGALVGWLGEVLAPPEKSRLRAFLESTS